MEKRSFFAVGPRQLRRIALVPPFAASFAPDVAGHRVNDINLGLAEPGHELVAANFPLLQFRLSGFLGSQRTPDGQQNTDSNQHNRTSHGDTPSTRDISFRSTSPIGEDRCGSVYRLAPGKATFRRAIDTSSVERRLDLPAGFGRDQRVKYRDIGFTLALPNEVTFHWAPRESSQVFVRRSATTRERTYPFTTFRVRGLRPLRLGPNRLAPW